VSVSDDSTHRVLINEDTKHVHVECFGMYPLDSSVDGAYNSVDELPEWMQSKLAVLYMLPLPPPSNDVEGVGTKISQHIYWVYKNES